MPDLPNLGLARSEAEGATPQVVCNTMREHNACTPKCHPSRCPPAVPIVYVPARAGDREAESPIEQEGEQDPRFVAEDPFGAITIRSSKPGSVPVTSTRLTRSR